MNEQDIEGSSLVRRSGHKEGCYAVKAVEDGDWPHPWYFTGERASGRFDSLGRPMGDRRGAGRDWLKVVCNDASCPGLWLVRRGVVEGRVVEDIVEREA